MTPSLTRNHRLVNQRIARSKFRRPQEVVEWFGAMQAQVFHMARWAIGLRSNGTNDAAVLKAFNEGRILRTHILRPTWHFVSPKDIRWMLKLSAPRVHAFNAFMYRKMGLDNRKLVKCSDIIVRSLEDGFKTRTELKDVLLHHKLKGDTVWLSCVMMYAELEGLICSGPMAGKQFTYALMDERVPKEKIPSDEEALYELTTRYFKSRGPATLQDYVWWSGLTVKQAKEGIAMLGDNFKRTKIDGLEYIFPKSPRPKNMGKLQTTYLMPDYDEYGIAYKNREALRNADIPLGKVKGESTVYSHWLVLNGVISGTWNKIEKKGIISREVKPFIKLSRQETLDVEKAVERYDKFYK